MTAEACIHATNTEQRKESKICIVAGICFDESTWNFWCFRWAESGQFKESSWEPVFEMLEMWKSQ